ncbi:MAG TPA: ferritin-like domain-containing protein [Gemmatimonadales bacterium]|nr:ferritin-like domain-containing protein [Gemmatimonadales bacterium]
MALDTMQELLVEELRDIYSAEQQLVKALPKLSGAVTAPSLQDALQDHLAETEGHVRRLEQVFEALGQKASGRKCKGMAGLVEEGEEMAAEKGSELVRDAGVISSAQRMEHYEIAAYGCAITHARLLGLEDVAALLEQTLAEEKLADEKLSTIAEQEVNGSALHVTH